MQGSDGRSAAERNRAYYGDLSAGKDDYWRKMAAPRFRVATLLGLVGEALAAQGGQATGRRLIDLGCGNGQLLAEIGRRYPELTLGGADISEPQLAENRRLMPGCDFHPMDLGRLDAVPAELLGRYDVVTASEVIEHLDQPQHLLANARRLLKKGGRLLLSTQSGPVRETERRVGHIRHFTAADLSALLERTSFKPLRVWNSGFPFHDLSKWYANRDPDASLREFAGGRYGPRQELLCFLLRVAFRFNSNRHGAQLFAAAVAC